ncbi:hypothetical protein METBIDRAFT_229507 [Metschnikowia bicuspidata var. bicuspidata NRRL YB-4993]|uniref:Uncharacterized protein n=1 Tax=Metschnikowia bicuspidata var. bicuspidata NRRL YB-4993 TaxID=869754 RepID=A0A1A0HAL4_9ASCO|nr:hypothetical protein METBIDRAFT_229507 [Metschnikowia bicuspidata var. bicuspidata NRRL YB-4993]OBA20918.1 hypothetical protein METBIDRAFT_229507 [Metschnikowia bicuspidata var. bicuspidata NRRL YB-4993]
MLAKKKANFIAYILFLSYAFAITVLGIRDVPERIVHTRTNPTTAKNDNVGSTASASSLHLMGVVPETRVKLKTDYIKEFLAFLSLNSFRTLAEPEKAPLKTKFTNLERILSDDTDLRTWTRFIVEDDRDEDFTPPMESSGAESIDLHIDDFIDYLVEHRGFSANDLQFLHDNNFDSDYDGIDDVLTTIKSKSAANDDSMSFLPSSGSVVPIKYLWVLPLIICLV